VVWIGALALARISSLGGMCAALAAPLAAWALGYPGVAPYLVAVAAIVIWLHRANIARLRDGTEPRLGAKK